ncbi:glutamate ligase domain-containing protein [Candidatus Nardonella dryophthoridicola]|uniref:glutamate ligase domain-containing protein n=1 Tax=Candidatus Nardonella dryophthoridicola TaxID=1971485 RepID=UPI002A4E127A|nr:cyanophycin synthetase [Candidatus Nardonella dryophthoridicola]
MKNLLIFHDYGHHPNEIFNIIYNIKKIYKRRIIMIFQPHRYSRTKILFYNYINILSKVDILILLDIYPANELNIFNINSYDLYSKIKKNKKNIIFYIKNINFIKEIFLNILKDNDIIIFQGAGTINNILLNFFNETL